MTETPALKPCPFCGEAPFQPIFDDVTKYHFVICDECQCEGPAEKTEDEAIAAWNKRSVGSSAPISAWQPIESAPKEEGPSFLIRTHAFGGRETVIIQVSRFEGRLYPDALGAAIDWDSAITHAKYWMPLPSAPVGSGSSDEAGGSIAPNHSLAPVSEEGQVDDSSLTVADPNAAPSVGDMERIKEHAHIVFSGCEDYPDKRRQSKYADWTWEQLKEKFHGSAVALLAYMEQRGYRIGRECAFHDYLFANGLKVGDGAIVPVDGSEITSPANGATEDATKVREPSSSQAALKGGRRDGD